MRHTKKEYKELGWECCLFDRQGTTVCVELANCYPTRHKIHRLAMNACPAHGLSPFILFKQELGNWCCQDRPGNTNPLKLFNNHDVDAEPLRGVPEEMSRIFFKLRDTRLHQRSVKKAGVDRYSMSVAVLFLNHFALWLAHVATGCVARNWPHACKAADHAQEAIAAIRKLIEALFYELTELKQDLEAKA